MSNEKWFINAHCSAPASHVKGSPETQTSLFLSVRNQTAIAEGLEPGTLQAGHRLLFSKTGSDSRAWKVLPLSA